MNKQKFNQFIFNGTPNQFIFFVENFAITIEAQIGENIFSSRLPAKDVPLIINQIIIIFKPFFEEPIFTPTEKYHYPNSGDIRITSIADNKSEVAVIIWDNEHQKKLEGIFYLLWLELQRQGWVFINDEEHQKAEKNGLGNEELLTNIPVFLRNKIFSTNYYESFEQEISKYLSKTDIFLEPLISVNYKQIQQESVKKIYLFGNLGDNNGEVLFGCIDKTKQSITAYCLVNMFWAYDFFRQFSEFLGLNPQMPNDYHRIAQHPKKITHKEKASRDKNQSPKWLPKTDAKKYKYRHLHPKIKSLYDRGKNYSEIGKELEIDRHEVSHILTWFRNYPEAYGK